MLMHNGKGIKVKAKAFQKMTRLRVLHLDHVILSAGYKLLFRNSGYKHLSRNLVWLCWQHFDLSVLPSQLYLENLAALDLSYSNIKRVWRGTKVKIFISYIFFFFKHWYKSLGCTFTMCISYHMRTDLLLLFSTGFR